MRVASVIVGAELADQAVRLAGLRPARSRAVLGHGQSGSPADAFDLLDAAVEIPMVGHRREL